MEIPRPELDELKRRTKAALSIISKATLPIINFPEDPELVASGVLVDVGTEVVMLTAAHVADQYYDGAYFVTLRGKDGSGTIPLGPPMVLRSPLPESLRRKDDPLDIALVRLPSAIQRELRNQYTPAPLELLHGGYGDTNTYYCAYGYPCLLSPTKTMMYSLHINPMHIVALHADLDVQVDPPYAKDVELLLTYEPGEDPEGNDAMPPYPEGMSGCGLWKVTTRSAISAPWSIQDVKLVGIVHTLTPEPSLLRATHIHYAKAAIAQSFKEGPEYIPPTQA